MPGLEARRWIIAYAATVLAQSELPMTLDEIFPAYGGPRGPRTIGRKLQRSVVDAMMKKGYVSSRRICGVEMYEKSNSGGLWSVAILEDEIGEVADTFGTSEAEMRNRRYAAKEAERKGKMDVSVGVLKKLLSVPEPQSRSSLFKARRGDKFEERAAWTPTWQVPLMDALVKVGAVRASGSPVVYEAADRELLRRIYEWKEKGPNCLMTLLFPDSPCDMDHALPESAPLDTPEVQLEIEPVRDPEPDGDPESAEAEAEAPPDQTPASAPEAGAQSAVLSVLDSITGMLGAQAKSHSMVLSTLLELAKTVKGLSDIVDELKDGVASAEEAAIEMQRKHEAAGLETSALGHQLNSVRKRLADLDKSASAEALASSSRHDFVKKAVSELAAAIASSHHQPSRPDTPVLEAIASLRTEVASRTARPRTSAALLKRLSDTADDLGALRDLALDSMKPAVEADPVSVGVHRGIHLDRFPPRGDPA